MTDQSQKTASLKETFSAEQQEKTDIVLAQAQKLVNMYRHADSFNEAFSAKLDELLLSSGQDVQVALSNIQGGKIVRRYFEFLQGKTPAAEMKAETPETAEVAPVGYLPSPEDDIPMTVETPVSGNGGINLGHLELLLKQFMTTHRSELNAVLQSQTEALSTLMQRLDQNTHEVATHQTDRLIDALKHQTDKQKQYSDVIEAPAQAPVLVPDDMEGF